MTLAWINPDIRCVDQLSLLGTWRQLAAGQGVPRIKHMPVAGLASAVERTAFCDVHPDRGGFGLFVRFQGAAQQRMYGVDCTGCYLDDLLPRPGRAQTLATLQAAATGSYPAFSRIRLLSSTRTAVQLDVLALPFRRRLFRVEMIVTLTTLFADRPFDITDFRNWSSAPT